MHYENIKANAGLAGSVPLINRDDINPPSNQISFDGNLVMNNGNLVRLAMTRSRIRIGCTTISAEAAQYIMGQYQDRFGVVGQEHVLQS